MASNYCNTPSPTNHGPPLIVLARSHTIPATVYHWEPADEPPKDYHFARFNVRMQRVDYSDDEYYYSGSDSESSDSDQDTPEYDWLGAKRPLRQSAQPTPG